MSANTYAIAQLGEVIFGGPGSGLYGMFLYAMMAVFLAALMVGRAPEYLGKHIAIFEMKMTCLAILIIPFLVLGGTALGVISMPGREGVGNPGTLPRHGLMFITLLLGTVILIGALTYIPALALGPIAEHLHRTAAVGRLSTGPEEGLGAGKRYDTQR